MASPTPRRRSARVKLNIPIVVAGRDAADSPFELHGQTVEVGKHGARIRVDAGCEHLRAGMDVQLSLSTKAQRARVVSVGKKVVGELAVELTHPGNFWGLAFPPLAGSSPDSESAEPLSQHRVAELRARKILPPETGAGPAAPSESGILTGNLEAILTGMSSIRAPFQEKSMVVPLGPDAATVRITPLVDVGATLRVVILPGKQSMKARTTGISRHRRDGKWTVWVKFSDSVFRA